MAPDPLAVYLNHHVAGSVAGLRLIEALAGRTDGTPLAGRLRALADEVREDQSLLRELLHRIEVRENRVAQAAAWVTEKVTEGRMAWSGRTHPELALLEGLESLALGLQGKLAVFLVLADRAPDDPRLAGLPVAERAARTAAQHAMVEQERLAAARAAFGTAAS